MEITKRDQSQGSQFPIQKTDGLDVFIGAGNLNVANSTVKVSPVKLTLTDDVVNSIYIDWNDTTIKSGVGSFPIAAQDLYNITCVSGVITLIEDRRSVLRVSCHTKFFTLADYFFNQDFNIDQGWTSLDLSSFVPIGTTVVYLRILVRDSGTIGDGVYFAAKHPLAGDTDWSRMIKALPIVSGLWAQMYYFPIGIDDSYKLEYNVQVSGTFSVKLAFLGVGFGGYCCV